MLVVYLWELIRKQVKHAINTRVCICTFLIHICVLCMLTHKFAHARVIAIEMCCRAWEHVHMHYIYVFAFIFRGSQAKRIPLHEITTERVGDSAASFPQSRCDCIFITISLTVCMCTDSCELHVDAL